MARGVGFSAPIDKAFQHPATLSLSSTSVTTMNPKAPTTAQSPDTKTQTPPKHGFRNCESWSPDPFFMSVRSLHRAQGVGCPGSGVCEFKGSEAACLEMGRGSFVGFVSPAINALLDSLSYCKCIYFISIAPDTRSSSDSYALVHTYI